MKVVAAQAVDRWTVRLALPETDKIFGRSSNWRFACSGSLVELLSQARD